MELIERAVFLTSLQSQFDKVVDGEGHCALVSGESGIGKTSLVRAFCREQKKETILYQGTCDALFTPHPLAPLYDIALQMGSDIMQKSTDIADRAILFTRIFQELAKQKAAILLVFEDVHWADEATLDFIKFLARRITGIRCLFILTYRDNEIHSRHPLRNVLGQLPAHSITRLHLEPLTREAVEKMAGEKGYNGEDVYRISGGNPFYVNEILASYSPGIPENIKDSILAVYNSQDDHTRQVWEILSVLPTGFELRYLEKMQPAYVAAIESALSSRILLLKDGLLFFKHELYRRTIEDSLSPLLRVSLNKRILNLFLESFEDNLETERIIHYAKNANEYELVVHYAPLAAKQAASVGAHIEACKLYLSAIEYYQGNDKDLLIRFYEAYAYECYLTNQMKNAIIYQGKALVLRTEKGEVEKTGNCMRFLSRLWWYDGNRKQAEKYGSLAVELLDDQPRSVAKAMAFSNMAQLKMLAGQREDCLLWGNKALQIAEALGAEEVVSHALNNIGTSQISDPARMKQGIAMVEQSLDIALKNNFQEHAARAYTNLGSNATDLRQYSSAKNILDTGIQYCEERDLESWAAYMSVYKARLNLETGNWAEAGFVAAQLVRNEEQSAIIKTIALVIGGTLKMRKGEEEAIALLQQAKTIAFETMELQRILPALTALLEYEWISGERIIEEAEINYPINIIMQAGNIFKESEFAYWLLKVRSILIPLPRYFEGYVIPGSLLPGEAAALWEQLGCPYEQALALFEGAEADKKKALSIVQELGAERVYEKMIQEMRASGIHRIPRGIRKATRANIAGLTSREMDILKLLQEGLQNKEIAGKLFISAKTVDHHISAILFKLDAPSRLKAVQHALRLGILK